MASIVLKEFQQESKPKHKEFANLYAPLMGSITDQDINNIAEELQCSEEEVETRLYEALRLFAVINATTQSKLLAINGNKRLIRSSDNSLNAINTQETIVSPRHTPSPLSKNLALDIDRDFHFNDYISLPS